MRWGFKRRDAGTDLARFSRVSGKIWELAGYDDYCRAAAEFTACLAEQQRLAQHLLENDAPPRITARCAVCAAPRQFRLADESGWAAFQAQPNWRETLVCQGCGLINRLRLSLELFETRCGPRPGHQIYLTERMTPLFAALQARYPDLTGSEFDQPQRRGGETFRVGEIEVRHEDLTDLSFASASFDHLLSFDVLEHVPDYQAAIGEMARVLKPDGHLLLTAPFDLARAQTLVRASLDDNGQLVHHETPEYHGDPVRSDAGILCFYHFGWDLLDRLRGAGFQQVSLLLAWDPARAYLGWGQSLILARR